LRHRFWFGLSERLGWSRGTFHESPARVLGGLFEQGERIAALQSRYQATFEVRWGIGVFVKAKQAWDPGGRDCRRLVQRSRFALDRPPGGLRPLSRLRFRIRVNS
jgi:hypothetical protein